MGSVNCPILGAKEWTLCHDFRRCIIIEKTKYNIDKDAYRRTYDDIVFDSVTEMKFFRDFVLPRVGSGEIVFYELQKPYELQPKFEYQGRIVQPIKYVADFYLVYSDGSEVVIDVKGMADGVAKIKRKIFHFVYPETNYVWVSYSAKDNGWINYDELQALRRERKRKSKNSNNER